MKLLVAIRMVDINVDQHRLTNLLMKYLETPLLTQGLEYIALHSSITKKFNSCNIYASNLDKIYAAEPAEPADMQLLLCKREFTILLCVGEAYRKCVWIIL